MTPGTGRAKVDATKRNGPVSAPFFTLEGKGNKEHRKEKIERSRFNTAPAKNDLPVVEYPVVTAEVEQILEEWKNNMMTAKPHVVIARQDGVSGLAEYIFETSTLVNELVSNEPSSNKSHVGEEPLATDTVELDPKDAYSTLYNGMEVRTTFSSFDKLAQKVNRLGGGSVRVEAPAATDQADQ